VACNGHAEAYKKTYPQGRPSPGNGVNFLAGKYGMNFRYMPGLTWEYGYYVIVIVMLLVAVGMLVHFRKKKWL